MNKLKNILNLDELPLRIESYDISNISGTDTVAGMVVFENGKPKKNEYRRIKIKTIVGQNDVECLKEVLRRRLKYVIGEHEKNPFGPKTNLILMDGGITQVRAAKEVLNDIKINIPTYGLVKNDKHRTRGVIDENGIEFEIHDDEVMHFVTFMQDEVHKTAIEYHRKLREKKTSKSVLDEIPGVGEKRKSELLKKFKTVNNILNASVEELEETEGIDKKTAMEIFTFIHSLDTK